MSPTIFPENVFPSPQPIHIFDIPNEILHSIILLSVTPSTLSGANVCATCTLFNHLGTQHLYSELNFTSYKSLLSFDSTSLSASNEWKSKLKFVRRFEAGDLRFEEDLTFTLADFPNLKSLQLHPSLFHPKKVYGGLRNLLTGLTSSLEELKLSSVFETKPSIMYPWHAMFDTVQPSTLLKNAKKLTIDYEEIKEFYAGGFSISVCESLEYLTLIVVDESPPYHEHQQEIEYDYDMFKMRLPTCFRRLRIVSYVADLPGWLRERIKTTFRGSGFEVEFEILDDWR